MNYISLIFGVFFIIFITVYYIVPAKYRYIILFTGSYIFYGYLNPKMLLVLVLVTLISYIGGLSIGKRQSKTAFHFFFLMEIFVLAVFKYTNFIVSNINKVIEVLLSKHLFNADIDIILPVGLSFMVFQAITYLYDVYHNNINPEKNIIKYASFVAFFPTVLSGPIQKARNLLPQISKPRDFTYDLAQKGTLLFIWGAFEKIMVANRLNLIHSNIITDYANHSSAEILIGAMCFSLYIYADFSSYSDMARGIGMLLGIDVGKNFNNPYLSKSTAEFWNRWHTSLNDWFKDIIYIPLGGNKRGPLRKYINMFIIFFVSGLWHGPYWHFVVWGILNWAFVIIGLVLKPYKHSIYQKMNVDENSASIVLLRRGLVFILVTLSWVFFNSGISDGIKICKKILLFNFISVFDPALFNIAGTITATFVTAITTLIFCNTQIKRQEKYNIFRTFQTQPFFFQCLSIAVIISICIFGALATDASIDTQFLYFRF
ncbi:MBOAT family O-acyltransferase [Butyrivibrio sp. YAB3001]|uniref:MBOAT family O-acyltransferase n=1 Tax=Butyrivibrio sp. YAB3001 TaxID=1520812 RepID=UPI0008F6387B|nr:MBOAT family O-acyltransferase [Butyrivibrio sp. YAB3001]SFC74769.1 D-alanyl-lipoteichoic acid acyltransferase DltB, MBOAT superfamily [Butyrivibrio sp. YAB3001]